MKLFRVAGLGPVLLLALAAGACTGQGRGAEPQTPADDNYDQEGWANTSPVGSGSETSSSYYGVGASPGPASHQPASARPAGGHRPR